MKDTAFSARQNNQSDRERKNRSEITASEPWIACPVLQVPRSGKPPFRVTLKRHATPRDHFPPPPPKSMKSNRGL